MKDLASIITLSVILLLLAACGSSTSTPTPATLVNTTPIATSATRTRQAAPARTEAATATPEPASYLKIVFLLSSFDGERQQLFKQLLMDNTSDVTGTVRIESADNDASKQREQVQAALDEGAPVLVIQPVDSDGAASFVDAAHKASAKVIAFDKLINTRDLDAYVSHDFIQIGRLQAQAALDAFAAKSLKAPYNVVLLEGAAGDPVAAGITRGYRQVLDPLIAKSQVKIAGDEAVADWSSDQAFATLQTILTKTKNNVQAVLANSSSLAQGALRALEGQKLIGKVFVAGANAELDNLRAVCSGSLDLEVMRDDARLATLAAQLAAAVADDRPIATNPLLTGKFPIEDREIAYAAIPVQAITRDTIQAQLVQTDKLAASELPRCFPPLVQGASVPTTTLRSSLVLWTIEKGDSALYNYLANLAAQFSAANPGVSVKIVAMDNAALREAFMRAGISDTPDLLWTTNEEIRQFAAANLLESTNSFSSSLFVESANAAATYQGTRYGIPISTGNNLLLYYNKKLLKDPPANTDALIRLAPTLTKSDQWTLVYDTSDPFWLMPWIAGYKGSVFVPNTISPTLFTSATVDALTLVKSFKDKKVAPPQMDIATADASFQEGKAALIINGDEALETYIAKLGTNLGTARIPQVSKGEFPRPFTGGIYFAIPRVVTGDRLDVAQTFARFVTSKPIQLDMARKFRRLPALRDALNDGAITSDPLLKGMADQLLVAIAPPETGALTCAWDAIKPNLQAVLADQEPPSDAARLMQTSVERCVGKLQ